MRKYIDGKYLDMTKEEVEALQKQEAEIEKEITITLTAEQLELLRSLLGGQI